MSSCTNNCNQGRNCTCSRLHTANSDGSNPHAETRDGVEVAIDITLFVVALFGLIFVLAALDGFFWGK